MCRQLSIFCISILFFSADLFAATINIQWNQPEVVHENLSRDNRRVLRFSGNAKPGTQVRVRDNKVKMIYSKSKTRWARIPQKNRVQFPVIASDTGYFSFDLYLPTTNVEIPLEVYTGGKWHPYRFAFDVPEQGTADAFKFTEESFKMRNDEGVTVEDFLSEYDRESDQGQVVGDGYDREWKSWVTGKIIVWGSLGAMYYNLEQEIAPGPPLGTFGSASFPAFEVGGEYRWSPQYKIDLSYANRAATIESDGDYQTQNNDFNWTQLSANLSYYPKSYEMKNHRFGLIGGVQMHDLPIVKQTGAKFMRVYTNSLVFIALGATMETMNTQGWNHEISGTIIYPLLVENEYDLDTGYGFNLRYQFIKEMIPAFYIGGKVDFHWLNMEANHPSITTLGQSVTADMGLWQLTPSVLVKAEF